MKNVDLRKVSRGADKTMTKVMTQELGPDGITVLAGTPDIQENKRGWILKVVGAEGLKDEEGDSAYVLYLNLAAMKFVMVVGGITVIEAIVAGNETLGVASPEEYEGGPKKVPFTPKTAKDVRELLEWKHVTVHIGPPPEVEGGGE